MERDKKETWVGLGWGWKKPSQKRWGWNRVLWVVHGKARKGSILRLRGRNLEQHGGVECAHQSSKKCRGQPSRPWFQWWRIWIYPLSDGEPLKEMLWKHPFDCRGGVGYRGDKTQGNYNSMCSSVDDNVTRDSQETPCTCPEEMSHCAVLLMTL